MNTSQNTSPPPDDPSILAMIGNQPLTIDEFENRYVRSVGSLELAAGDSLAEYEDFLDRYIDFRLKVRYAEELGMERDSSLLKEIDTYRAQLARPFLLEKEILDPILRDLYEKQQVMVDASHILVRLGPNAAHEDTLAAYTEIAAIRDSALSGIDFGDLAFRNSDDPSARGNRRGARGRLGYFDAGVMVKAFEDRAFETPVGEVSDIFRSQFGYHILYVHDKKPSVPDAWVSHIATRRISRGLDDTTTAEQRIQALYERLQNGEDFAELAKKHSEDLESRPTGGSLGRISYTDLRVPESFRNALFTLEKPGDFTDIVSTPYGLHIIKLDKREEKKSFEESYEELKAQASRLPRVRRAEIQMARSIRDDVGFSVDTTQILTILDGLAFNTNGIQDTPDAEMQTRVIAVGDSTYTFGEIVDFAELNSIPYNPDTLAMVYNTLDSFLDDAALNYEAARLEFQDDEFGGIMEEFRDGLLLFKLMEDSVWTAAAQDTAALMAYHTPRTDSFSFPDRHRIVSFRNRSDSLLQVLQERLNRESLSEVVQEIEQDTTLMVRIDTTYISEPNNSVFDKALSLGEGESTEPEIHSGSYMFMVNDGIEQARLKTFEEARSELINAYQAILEERLLQRLRERYNVAAYKDRLSAVFAGDSGGDSPTSSGNSGEDTSSLN